MSEVNLNRSANERSEAKPAEELLPLVYEQLRQLAAHKLANERPGQTLQPTALVHEAWLRLTGNESHQFAGRAHFFAAAAEAMRRILIDRARRRRALRHGGGQERVKLEDVDLPAPVDDDDQLLAINEALEKFAAEDPQKAELVKLRYFVGMTFEEAAQTLGISEPTAKRWWTFARAWLYREVNQGVS
jgi:RNA polymerase sigma factor (TIGR02999 family)